MLQNRTECKEGLHLNRSPVLFVPLQPFFWACCEIELNTVDNRFTTSQKFLLKQAVSNIQHKDQIVVDFIYFFRNQNVPLKLTNLQPTIQRERNQNAKYTAESPDGSRVKDFFLEIQGNDR